MASTATGAPQTAERPRYDFAGYLAVHQAPSLRRPHGRPSRFCLLSHGKLSIFNSNRAGARPALVVDVQNSRLSEVRLDKTRQAFTFADQHGNRRVLLSTTDAGSFSSWSAAFAQAQQSAVATPRVKHADTQRDATEQATSSAPASPRWARPRRRTFTELTPSKSMNKHTSSLFDEERAADIVAPVMGAPFCMALLLAIVLLGTLVASVTTRGWLYRPAQWARLLAGTAEMRKAVLLGAMALGVCAWATLAAANLAAWLQWQEQRFGSRRLTEVACWVLHLLFSLAAPVVIVLRVCHAESAPSPVLAGAFTMLAITLLLKLVNFAVHQWHSREIVRAQLRLSPSGPLPPTSLPQFAYFLVAPTLNFARHFPRTARVRLAWLARQCLGLAAILNALGLVVSQLVEPQRPRVVEVVNTRPLDVAAVAALLLDLAFPLFVAWLGIFVALFHFWLGILAEVTRFGDRRFYTDWWNAPTVAAFWNRWNLPVHNWALTTVYAPLKSLGFSKPLASIAIFFVSALLHELALSAPLQVQQGWAFVGMLAQVPMIVLTAGTTSLLQRWRVHESHIFLSGNAALWVSMCFIGQPMCVVLYIAAFSAKHDL